VYTDWSVSVVDVRDKFQVQILGTQICTKHTCPVIIPSSYY